MQGVIGFGVAKATGTRTVPERAEEKDASESESEDEDEDGAPDATRMITFGPFLALGALEFLFFGDAIVAWYLRQFE
jgi:hypothetical protein